MAQVQSSSQIWGDRLQNIPRPMIYLVLILAAVIPQFFTAKLPDIPSAEAIDLYTTLMAVPDGSTVLFSSDWDNGTRAENGAEFDAVMKILMRKHVKAVFYTIGGAPAVQVAKTEIEALNDERRAHNEPTYNEWTDWVSAGFFPSAEGTAVSLASNVKGTFQGKTGITPTGQSADITTSPVLQNVSTLHDIPLLIDVTGSSTTTVYLERVSSKVKLAFLVTGVMVPELIPYTASGQVKGLAKGLRGAFDLENLMDTGVNYPGPDGKIAFSTPKSSAVIPPSSGRNAGQATTYMLALHSTLVLLIVAIIVGNVGMFLSRRART